MGTLEAAGFEAWLAGGCVRDMLLGVSPQDFDLTTDALPRETAELFSACPVIETGLKHGTLTVVVDGMPLEITTYRVDGAYTDGRHPDQVYFSKSLEADLSRRDFTINAMAYNEGRGLKDPFGGREDLEARLLRCVGDPVLRFQEDALRILRALRFSSVLGFSIESQTGEALRQEKALLARVSAPRIASELLKLLCGKNVRQILLDYTEVLAVPLPELLPLKGLEPRNPRHIYDVLGHTAAAVEAIEPLPRLRLAALFHDLGKAATFSVDDLGVGHFYGHPQESVRLTADILERLGLDHRTRDRVLALIRFHDVSLEAEPAPVKRLLRKLGPEGLRDLILLKRADNLAQHPRFRQRQLHYDRLEELLETLLAQDACFSRKDLAVKGDDLLAMGMEPGKALGRMLDRLLELVIEEKLPNEKDTLLNWAETHCSNDD
ncbi:MAG: HD domain-containing protein [Bacillota bacterium]|nr:HD domain-containing protein [Bacillota bacterium]